MLLLQLMLWNQQKCNVLFLTVLLNSCTWPACHHPYIMSSPSLIHACQHHRHYLTIETNAWYTLLWEPQKSLHNHSLQNTTSPSCCSFNFLSPTTFSKNKYAQHVVTQLSWWHYGRIKVAHICTTCSDTAELVTLWKDQSSAHMHNMQRQSWAGDTTEGSK